MATSPTDTHTDSTKVSRYYKGVYRTRYGGRTCTECLYELYEQAHSPKIFSLREGRELLQ